MKNLFKQLFARKSQEKKDFSNFFRTASREEQEKLMKEVAHKANEDQRTLFEQYHKAK